VWTFGVVLFEIFSCGETPYGELSSTFEIRMFILSENVLPRSATCPAEIYEVICQCCQADHKKRPSFPQIEKLLSAPVKKEP